MSSAIKTQQDVGNNNDSNAQLRTFVERIERLEEEKKAMSEDITEVYNEAKNQGFDAKVMREIIKIRKKPASEQEELESLLDLYKHALGMI